MKSLYCLLITTLLTVASYGADNPDQLKGYFDRPIGIRVQKYKGENHEAIRNLVAKLLIKAGAKIYKEGPYDHDIFIAAAPIVVDGKIVQYYITVMPNRKMEYTNPAGEKLTWRTASLHWMTDSVPKDEKLEGVEDAINFLINQVKIADSKK